MNETPCLVCGAHDLAPHLEILRKCRVCGFVTARLDAPVDTRAIYDGSYFTGEEYLDYAADEAFFKKNFRNRMKAILARCDAGRLLEIGAAYGFFLDLARQHFEVTGFELSRDAAQHAREQLGLDVRTDDFLDVDVSSLDRPFDVIVMWDVIEHLDRPDRFIARFAELSRTGTLLYLTTGDIGSRLARLRGRKWRLIHPPSHLHYFDRSTITRLLNHHGFDVVDIRSAGVARSFRQILYSVFVLALERPRIYRTLERLTPQTWGFTLNTGDIMQVVARKQAQ